MDTTKNKSVSKRKIHVHDLEPAFDAVHYIEHGSNGWWTVHEGRESCFATVSVPREDDAVREWNRINEKQKK